MIAVPLGVMIADVLVDLPPSRAYLAVTVPAKRLAIARVRVLSTLLGFDQAQQDKHNFDLQRSRPPVPTPATPEERP